VAAVAVDDGNHVAYAESAPDLVLSKISLEPDENSNAPVAPALPWYKGRSTIGLLSGIVLLLAVVIGLSLGLHNTSSNDPLKNIEIFPSNAPITTLPTTPPISALDPNFAIQATVLTSYINNITLTNQTIAANGTSSESKALAWMISNDTTLDTLAVISMEAPIARNAIGFRI
jgi:hypothetical protein